MASGAGNVAAGGGELRRESRDAAYLGGGAGERSLRRSGAVRIDVVVRCLRGMPEKSDERSSLESANCDERFREPHEALSSNLAVREQRDHFSVIQ